jgi:hypothetical protein
VCYRAHHGRAGIGGRRDQVERKALVEDADAGRGPCFGEQAAVEFAAGLIAHRVVDACEAVPAFKAHGEALASAIELHAPFEAFLQTGRAALEDELDRGAIAEPCAGAQRVGEVGLDAIGRNGFGQHGGDAALGPRRVVLAQLAFREHDNLAVGGRRDRRSKPRDAGTDHERAREHLRQQRRTKRDQVASTVVLRIHWR